MDDTSTATRPAQQAAGDVARRYDTFLHFYRQDGTHQTFRHNKVLPAMTVEEICKLARTCGYVRVVLDLNATPEET